MEELPTYDEIWQENVSLRNTVRVLEQEIKSLQDRKGSIKLEYFDNSKEYWKVVEHIMANNAANARAIEHYITKQSVAEIWSIISRMCDLPGKSITYRKLVPEVIKFYQFDKVGVNPDNFAGGKNRARIFFSAYYYQVKILAYTGFIKYNERGTVMRMK